MSNVNDLIQDFSDTEYREAYADDYLNTYVATQITVLREQRGLSQDELADMIGTKQPGISRLENVNHSSWKTDTLKKLAKAFGVRLRISFETYGDLLFESETFGRRSLQRATFHDDPVFKTVGVRRAKRQETAEDAPMLASLVNGSKLPLTPKAQPPPAPSGVIDFDTRKKEILSGRKEQVVSTPPDGLLGIVTHDKPEARAVCS